METIMGKFNISTKSGQLTDLEQASQAQLPVEQEQETVEPAGSAVDNLLEQQDVQPLVDEAIGAGLEQEGAIQEQKEKEAVPDIISRRDDANRIDQYQYKAPEKKAEEANTGPSGDGGMAQRARNMADVVQSGELSLAGLKAGSNLVTKTMQDMGAIKEDGTVDRPWLQMASVITENFMNGAQYNQTNDEMQIRFDDDIEAQQSEQRNPVTKAQGNKQLGNQIYQEYVRWKNSQDPNNQREIGELDPESATVLGDAAKELYYETNKGYGGQAFITRGSTPDGQVAFTITKHGADLLNQGSAQRKRMFPKQHVRPSKTPLPGGSLVGEGKLYTRRVSGAVGGVIGADVIKAAMRNLNSVPNVVDKQRLKVLLSTVLPVLRGELDPNHPFYTINNVGLDKLNEFRAKQKKNPDFNADEAYESLINDLAQDLFGIATERNGANYLTYYLQAATGRIAPQQSHFDPTRSKAVRFVTRNAVPANTKNKRVERALRQMYAMMLVKDADTAYLKNVSVC